jgi:hypothetical protein
MNLQVMELKQHLQGVVYDNDVPEPFKFKALNWLFLLDHGAGKMGWDTQILEEANQFFDDVEYGRMSEKDQSEFNW